MYKLIVLLFVALMVTKSLSLNTKRAGKEELNTEAPTHVLQQGVTAVEDGLPTPNLLQKLKCLANCPKSIRNREDCGTDGITYPSIGFLECVKSCGIKVDLKSMQLCPGTTPSTLL